MGKCLFMRKGETHTEPITFKANFADNDWSTIVKACQKNQVPDTWVVGSQRAMVINGTSYVIDIIGKNHDEYSDGSGKAPLTFQLHDCYGTTYELNSTQTNSGGWTDSVMRNTSLPAIMSLMPSEVREGLRKVNKPTTAGAGSNEVKITDDKLFLLSEIEIIGNVAFSRNGEGTQYDYYKAGNTKAKKIGNTVGGWWTRSPYYGDIYQFCYLNASGNSGAGYSNQALGVAFAFCF